MRTIGLLLCIASLMSGCAGTEYEVPPTVIKGAPVQVFDSPPKPAHVKLGLISVHSDAPNGVPLESLVADLANEGGQKGCEFVVCHFAHELIQGVGSRDQTGVQYATLASGERAPVGLVGQCETYYHPKRLR